MNRSTIEQLARWILDQQELTLVCHVSPDGDTLGSALALKLALNELGRRAVVCCADKIPGMYDFLPGAKEIFCPETLPGKAVLCVDVASADRMGRYQAALNTMSSACIDHHDTNPGYCGISVVEGEASATAVVVIRLLDVMKLRISRDMAACLYAAITSDTGRFMYSLTNSEALTAGARCLERPIDLEEIGFRLFRRKSLVQNKLLGYALNAMYLRAQGRVAVIELPESAFAQTGAAPADTDGIVNYGVETEGVQVAVQAQQKGELVTKFSLRSRGAFDVSKIASQLGGGGHANAAGLTLELPMKAAVERVLKEIETQMQAETEA